MATYNMRPWTDEEIARLKQLRDRRMKWSDIARVMGRGKNTVNKMYSERFGFSTAGNTWTKEEEEALRKAVRAGNSIRQASEIIGRPYGAVKDKSYRMGLADVLRTSKGSKTCKSSGSSIGKTSAELKFEAMCKRGSRKLLAAYIYYFKKHHPEREAARLAA